MTKLPQATLGYCVDGVVVFRPTRRIALKPESKKKIYPPVYQYRPPVPIPKPSHADDLRMHPKRIDLKNASKQGNLNGAMDALGCLVREWCSSVGKFKRPTRSQKFARAVKLLFAPDIENRSAVYYAAHAGQEHLVEAYLALVLLAMAVSSNKRSSKKLSTPQWLKYFAKSTQFFRFRHSDWDLCYRSALSQEIRDMLMREKYDFSDVLESYAKIISVSLRNSEYWVLCVSFFKNDPCSNNKYTLSRKKAKRPLLNTSDDPFILDDLDELEYEDGGELVGIPPLNENDSVTNTKTRKASSSRTDPIWTKDDFPALCDAAGDNLSIHSTDLDLDNFREESSSISFVEEETDTFVEIYPEETDSVESVWEAVELDSVISLDHTMPLSFCDLLKVGGARTPEETKTVTYPSAKSLRSKLSRRHSEIPDLTEDVFDADFVVEGMKGIRGGREQYKYGKEPKTSRSFRVKNLNKQW